MKRKVCKKCRLPISVPHARDCPNAKSNNWQDFTIEKVKEYEEGYRDRYGNARTTRK